MGVGLLNFVCPKAIFILHIVDFLMKRLIFFVLAALVAFTGFLQREDGFGQSRFVNLKNPAHVGVAGLIDGRDDDRITALLTSGFLRLAFSPAIFGYPLLYQFSAKDTATNLKLYLLQRAILI
jgi:hypothetical protein